MCMYVCANLSAYVLCVRCRVVYAYVSSECWQFVPGFDSCTLISVGKQCRGGSWIQTIVPDRQFDAQVWVTTVATATTPAAVMFTLPVRATTTVRANTSVRATTTVRATPAAAALLT